MAAGSYERKQFVGGAPQRTLVGSITDDATSLVIDDDTGWPAGADPFVITIGIGTATEEKVLVSSRVGTTLTLETRGYDNTTAIGHADGATVDHTLDASTIDQVNRLANLLTARGDVFASDGTNPMRVAGPPFSGVDGANEDGFVLLIDHNEPTGVKWARPEVQTIDASEPAVDGAVRVWLDQASGLVRISDGAAWLIPGVAAVVADDAARDALFGSPPTFSSMCINAGVLQLWDGSTWVDYARRDEAIPKVADAAARDALYPSPSTGDHVFITGTHRLEEYREDEWILVNQKITVSETSPTDPHDGDIWIQPTG